MGQSLWINAGLNGSTSSCPDSGFGNSITLQQQKCSRLQPTLWDSTVCLCTKLATVEHRSSAQFQNFARSAERSVEGFQHCHKKRQQQLSGGRPPLSSAPLRNVCVESDWPSNQTFSEQRGRGSIWSSSKVSTRLKVVTVDKWEMKQQEGNE